MEILYRFYASVCKNFLGIMEKICNICIDIDIDTRESIDTYRYFKISISIDTFRITTPSLQMREYKFFHVLS